MSQKNFAKTLAAAGVIHNREVTEFMIDVYLAALKGYDIAECTKALGRLITTSKFMPKPADIIEFIEGDGRGRALAAWPQVEKLAANSAAAKSDDPITEAVVQDMGGWRRFGLAEYREYPFLQKEFIDRYESYSKTPALLERALHAALGVRTNQTLKIADIGALAAPVIEEDA